MLGACVWGIYSTHFVCMYVCMLVVCYLHFMLIRPLEAISSIHARLPTCRFRKKHFSSRDTGLFMVVSSPQAFLSACHEGSTDLSIHTHIHTRAVLARKKGYTNVVKCAFIVTKFTNNISGSHHYGTSFSFVLQCMKFHDIREFHELRCSRYSQFW